MPRLEQTFQAIALAAPAHASDWWIIGSAGLVLLGIQNVAPDDIDILASKSTALAFLEHWGAKPLKPAPDSRFRSAPYARIALTGRHRIEVMGDLEVRADDAWQKVILPSRIPVQVGTARLFVASLSDQISLLRLFGREKDLAKVRLLEKTQAEDLSRS